MPKNGITTKKKSSSKSSHDDNNNNNKNVSGWLQQTSEKRKCSFSLFICGFVCTLYEHFFIVYTYSTTLKNNKDFKLKRMGKVFGENNITYYRTYNESILVNNLGGCGCVGAVDLTYTQLNWRLHFTLYWIKYVYVNKA